MFRWACAVAALISTQLAYAADCPEKRPEIYETFSGYATKINQAFKPKSEFETTAQFELRRQAAIAQMSKPVALFHRIDRSDFTYDADTGKLRHRRGLETLLEIVSSDSRSVDFVELNFDDSNYKTSLEALFDFKMEAPVAEIFRTSSPRNSIDYLIWLEPREPFVGFEAGRLPDGKYTSTDVIYTRIICVFPKALDIYPN